MLLIPVISILLIIQFSFISWCFVPFSCLHETGCVGHGSRQSAHSAFPWGKLRAKDTLDMLYHSLLGIHFLCSVVKNRPRVIFLRNSHS